MALLVQKYGGTSVGTPERMRAVAKRIAKAAVAGNQVVVVVSAMGRSTDELIALAHRVSTDPSPREMDMLLTAGERISMALLSMALADLGVSALSFTGSQTGIITDHSHRRARIRRILGDRVRAALAEGKVAIVAGFQGVSETKEITTLGRGGSDTTAVALAAALRADVCEIYTDVAGVYSADPRVVQNPRLWRSVGHEVMAELASLGAGVLHPRCVELAKRYRVNLRVRSSLIADTDPHHPDYEGTEVTDTSLAEKGMEEFQVTGVTADSSKAWISLELMRASVMTTLWDVAADANLSITAPVFNDREINFFASRESESDWKRILQRLATEGFVNRFAWDSAIVPLSVVGERFSQDGRALARIFDVLAKEGMSAVHGCASALSVTVAVRATHADDAVRSLHQQFFDSRGDGK